MNDLFEINSQKWINHFWWSQSHRWFSVDTVGWPYELRMWKWKKNNSSLSNTVFCHDGLCDESLRLTFVIVKTRTLRLFSWKAWPYQRCLSVVISLEFVKTCRSVSHSMWPLNSHIDVWMDILPFSLWFWHQNSVALDLTKPHVVSSQ